MPAPHNPYRRGRQDEALFGQPIMREGRMLSYDAAAGFSALDIDAAAHRNYRLGREHGFRDREAQVDELQRRLDTVPEQAYNQGYDSAEREVVELMITLLEPPVLLATMLKHGRRNGKALTPKARDDLAGELRGSVLALAKILDESIRETVETRVENGTAARLRDAMRDHS